MFASTQPRDTVTLRTRLDQTLAAVRRYTQERHSLTLWLDAGARHSALIAFGLRRNLIGEGEAARWQCCGDDPQLASPTECPAWAVVYDAQDGTEALHADLLLLTLCTCSLCNHHDEIMEIRGWLAPDPI